MYLKKKRKNPKCLGDSLKSIIPNGARFTFLCKHADLVQILASMQKRRCACIHPCTPSTVAGERTETGCYWAFPAVSLDAGSLREFGAWCAPLAPEYIHSAHTHIQLKDRQPSKII